MFCFNIIRPIRVFFLIAIFDLACLPSANSRIRQPNNELAELRTGQAQEPVNKQSEMKTVQSPDGLKKYLGKFKVTFYWIVKESEYSGSKDIPLYLETGKVLGYFPSDFISDFKKESCAELKDGKLISYLKRTNKVRVVREPLGYGGYTIAPFKSIAVDQDIISIGSKLYVPELTKLHSHNGIVYAHDIGSMINGNSIDIFVGYKENTRLFTKVGVESSGLVDVYLLE